MKKITFVVCVFVSFIIICWNTYGRKSIVNSMVRNNIEALSDGEVTVTLQYVNCRESGNGSETFLCDANAVLPVFQNFYNHDPVIIDPASIGANWAYLTYLINHPEAQYGPDYNPGICQQYGKNKMFGKYGLCYEIVVQPN